MEPDPPETYLLSCFTSSELLSSVKPKCCHKWLKIVTKSSKSPPFRPFNYIIYLRHFGLVKKILLSLWNLADKVGNVMDFLVVRTPNLSYTVR